MSHRRLRHSWFSQTSLWVAVFCLSTAPASAQQPPPPLKPGVRVRVELSPTDSTPASRFAGSLVRLANDTAVIARGTRLETIKLDEGARLHVRTGSRGHARQGFAIGGTVGLLLGAAIGHGRAAADCGDGAFSGMCELERELEGLTVGGLVGGVAGLVIGASIRDERWAFVETSGLRVVVKPKAIGLSLAF